MYEITCYRTEDGVTFVKHFKEKRDMRNYIVKCNRGTRIRVVVKPSDWNV